MVHQENNPPTPRLTYSLTENGGEIIAVAKFPDTAQFAQEAHLVVKNSKGKILPYAEKNLGQYIVNPVDSGLINFELSPSDKDSVHFDRLSQDVFFGDFRNSLNDLKQRINALDPIPSGTDFRTILQTDLRNWLSYWISEITSISDDSLNGVLVGKHVIAYKFALEMVEAFEHKVDIYEFAKGRQLPARVTLKARTANSFQNISFIYILRIPQNSSLETSHPLLVIVHGFTPDPNTTSGVRLELEEVAQKMEFPFITASLTFDGDMREKKGWAPDEVAGFVEHIIDRYQVDSNRVYISGFSMGGEGINRTVAHRPDLFAAFSPLCGGGGDPEWADAVAAIPAYLFHGDMDEAVPCYRSKVFYEALKAAGADPKFRIYSGLGHSIWKQVYADPEFYEWLLSHERAPILNHAPISAKKVQEIEGSLELSSHLTPRKFPNVYWIDTLYKLSDLNERDFMRSVPRQLQNYPQLPVTGGLLISFPEGLCNLSSPMKIGTALETPIELPEGWIAGSLKETTIVGVLRHISDLNELINLVDLHPLYSSEDCDEENIILELDYEDYKNGKRFLIHSF